MNCPKFSLVTVSFGLFVLIYTQQAYASEWFKSWFPSFDVCSERSKISLPCIPKDLKRESDWGYCKQVLTLDLPGRREELRRHAQRVFENTGKALARLEEDSARMYRACIEEYEGEELCLEKAHQLATTLRTIEEQGQEIVCFSRNIPLINTAEAELLELSNERIIAEAQAGNIKDSELEIIIGRFATLRTCNIDETRCV